MDSAYVVVVIANPLTVQLPSGDVVPAIPVTGLTYTAGGACLALIKQGSVPVAIPITTSGVPNA